MKDENALEALGENRIRLVNLVCTIVCLHHRHDLRNSTWSSTSRRSLRTLPCRTRHLLAGPRKTPSDMTEEGMSRIRSFGAGLALVVGVIGSIAYIDYLVLFAKPSPPLHSPNLFATAVIHLVAWVIALILIPGEGQTTQKENRTSRMALFVAAADIASLLLGADLLHRMLTIRSALFFSSPFHQLAFCFNPSIKPKIFLKSFLCLLALIRKTPKYFSGFLNIFFHLNF